VCAICKVELQGPLESFFLMTQLSIKIYAIIVARMYKLQLIPHHIWNAHCHRNVQIILPMPRFLQKMIVKVESAPAAGALKQTDEKNQVKNAEVKSITWGDIVVGDIKSQQVQDKGMMVKSVVTILCYKAELFTAWIKLGSYVPV